MDELIDKLIRDETFCDVTLPRISKRHVLEEEGVIEAYQSALNIQEEDLPEEVEEIQQQQEEVKNNKYRSPSSSSSSYSERRRKSSSSESRHKVKKRE